jgi:hypothetical protein
LDKRKKKIALAQGEKKNDGHGKKEKTMARGGERFNKRERACTPLNALQ